MKRKVFSYIRVSTDEQASQGYSIPAQQQVLKDYAKGHNLEIVQEFIESESAYKPGRPRFEKMLKILKKQRDVTAVLCYKIDRIARNLRDYSALSEMVGVDIISATEELPDNSTGQLIGGVQAVFSRYFSDQLSERVKLGMQTKAKSGVWPSYAPTGYLNDPVTKGIIPDSEMDAIVRELLDTYARKDVSLSQLVDWARERGLRTKKGGILGKSAIHKLLTNPIYYGTIRWNGVLYEGVHEPLISKNLFDRVQERLKGKSSPHTKRSFPYRGILTCGLCGCKITASLVKRKYIYYWCTQGRGKCLQPYVRQEQLGERLLGVVEGVHLSREQVVMLLDMMKREKSRRQAECDKKIHTLKKKLHISSKRREAVYVDKLDGTITEEYWLTLERKWSEEEDTLRSRIVFLEAQQEPSVDDAQATFELLERAPELYSKQSDTERARLLRTLVLNCRLNGDKIEPIYKKPFDLVASGLASDNWYAREDSNLRPSHPQCDALFR